MKERTKVEPIPVEIEAYRCPVCQEILYVSTPEKDVITFTKKQIERHVNKKVIPALPEGLCFTYVETRKGVVSTAGNYYNIIVDRGLLVQGTFNAEGFPSKCYPREYSHTYEHKRGGYDVASKTFLTKSWYHDSNIFSGVFRGALGRGIRLLTPEEFEELGKEFRDLKSNPQLWAENHRLFGEKDLSHFLSVDKLVRTTPELEALINRRQKCQH